MISPHLIASTAPRPQSSEQAKPIQTWDNPAGTNGFEFVEFTAPNPGILHDVFTKMGFSHIARHRAKEVSLYRQGGINFLVNAEPEGFAHDFAVAHGPSINAFAFRVDHLDQTIGRATEKGAMVHIGAAGPMELNIPAIQGVGGSLLYLVDRYDDLEIYDIDFEFLSGANDCPVGPGLTQIDHLTHNVFTGHLDAWAKFYEDIFNFREIRHFHIEGELTGLRSRAMMSPCGKIRIPINEEATQRTKHTGQIAEFLQAYHGEGVQHVALATDHLAEVVIALRAKGTDFMETPATYYESLDDRLPGHGLDTHNLQQLGILADGSPRTGEGLLLQIFTKAEQDGKSALGPVFFELIERRGNDGFGEGNFQALFDALERDQLRRGVIKAKH